MARLTTPLQNRGDVFCEGDLTSTWRHLRCERSDAEHRISRQGQKRRHANDRATLLRPRMATLLRPRMVLILPSLIGQHLVYRITRSYTPGGPTGQGNRLAPQAECGLSSSGSECLGIASGAGWNAFGDDQRLAVDAGR